MRNLYSRLSVLFLFLSIFNGCKEEQPITQVSINGEEIHFINEGEGDTALVFVHGYTNNKEIWEEQVSYFSKKYKVIAVDLPGFGKSSHNRTDWTIENYGKDVAGLVQKLNLKKVVLIGFSMGTPVVIEAADMLKDETIGLILVDNIKDVKINYPDEAIEGIKAFMNDIIDNPTEEKLVNTGFIKQNTSENFLRVKKMLDEATSRVGWDDIFTNLIKWSNEKDEAALSKLKFPVTLINSDFEPTNSEQLKQVISNLEIEIVKNSGHCIFWDFPEEFNALIEKSVQKL